MASSTRTFSTTHIVARIAAGLLGAYGFCWGFVSFGITGLVTAGVAHEDAYFGVMLVAFLVFLVAFCGAFVAASLVRVWAVLAGGGVLMTTAAWLLQRALLASPLNVQ